MTGLSESYASATIEGTSYALVIGISTYKYGRPPKQELSDKEFTNLGFADKDAEEFAKLLRSYGTHPYNVLSLVNADATRRAIVEGFEKLSVWCKDANNPLVTVFFAGHGMPDGKKHYLVPWDGERDSLSSTAFSNKSFTDYLADLETDRLVVFLDACHSGAMGLKGARAGTVLQYAAPANLGHGKGRFLIASCSPGQQSYEDEDAGHGIFTGHLLQLLHPEKTDIEDEEIRVLSLFEALSKKVVQTARKKKRDQEPFMPFTEGATGIVLAINERVRRARIQKTNLADKKRREFLEIILNAIEGSTARQKVILSTRLVNYVQGVPPLEEYKRFYKMFDEHCEMWEPGDHSLAALCCDDLIRLHQELMESRKSSQKPPNTANGSQGRLTDSGVSLNAASVPQPLKGPETVIDDFVREPSTKVVGSEQIRSPSGPVTSANQDSSRRRFSADDRKYILEAIRTNLEYWSEAQKLDRVLSVPVTQREIAEILFGIRLSGDDQTVSAILGEIVGRFKERWPGAEKVESMSVSSVMIEKNKDE